MGHSPCSYSRLGLSLGNSKPRTSIRPSSSSPEPSSRTNRDPDDASVGFNGTKSPNSRACNYIVHIDGPDLGN